MPFFRTLKRRLRNTLTLRKATKLRRRSAKGKTRFQRSQRAWERSLRRR